MRDRWNAARVGLMVVFGVVAIVAVYRYVDERSSPEKGYSVHAYFLDVQGLIPKSRVLVAGIPVGYIESIDLEGGRARVQMHIEAGVPLYVDAMVSMRSISFLGERVLAIEPGNAMRARLEDGGEILAVEGGVQTDDILASVNEIAKSLQKVAKQFERAFGSEEAGTRMESALEDLSEALDGINRTIQSNEENINNTLLSLSDTTQEIGPRLVNIMENVESATGNLSEIIENRKGDLDRGVGEVDDTLVAIRRAAEDLAIVLEDVSEVTSRTARGEGSLGRLTHDEQLIDEVEGVAKGLDDFIGGFGRLRTIVGLRTEYYVLANAFKTYFSLRLQPRENRYYLIEVVDDPRGKVSISQSTIQTSPAPIDEPGEFRETRITRSDALKFTIMMAKRIRFATFRFGILESTGGLSLILHGFGDRLEIYNDLFDLNISGIPRYRVRAQAELLRRFWIIAGADDIFSSRRDFFFGAQLRFDDEDLKGLLPFAGTAALVQ